jgi:hypothetical protein
VICQLCLEDKTLIKAHIVPKAFYKDSFGVGSSDAGKMFTVSNQSEERKIYQAGIWDNKILCGDCDNRISIFDKYAVEFFRGAESWQVTPIETETIYKIEDFDYKKLKLFFISLLWRMSITTHDFYYAVSLGSLHESKARQLLIEDNPGTNNDFSVFISRFIPDEGKNSHHIFFSPRKQRNTHFRTYYTFCFAGFDFFIKVDSQKLVSPLDEFCLQDSEGLVIINEPFKDSWQHQQALRMMRK